MRAKQLRFVSGVNADTGACHRAQGRRDEESLSLVTRSGGIQSFSAREISSPAVSNHETVQGTVSTIVFEDTSRTGHGHQA